MFVDKCWILLDLNEKVEGDIRRKGDSPSDGLLEEKFVKKSSVSATAFFPCSKNWK